MMVIVSASSSGILEGWEWVCVQLLVLALFHCGTPMHVERPLSDRTNPTTLRTTATSTWSTFNEGVLEKWLVLRHNCYVSYVLSGEKILHLGALLNVRWDKPPLLYATLGPKNLESF